MTGKSLVSVGIPTYNRSSLLERAIKSIAGQDYPDLEIVISDNASTDATREVCHRMQALYPFIRYHRVSSQIQPFKNFSNALRLSTGRFFMWAADDDLWEPTFISSLVECLQEDTSLALAAAEAQYMLPDGTKLPCFSEGAHYHGAPERHTLRRLRSIIGHNYGNLIYGVYRREALLFQNDDTAMDVCEYHNEIPIFLTVAARGSVKVLDKVLFYKTTTLNTYIQAAREYGFKPNFNQEQLTAIQAEQAGQLESIAARESGSSLRDRLLWLPRHLRGSYRYAVGNFSYHRRSFKDMRGAIRRLEISTVGKCFLLLAASIKLARHFFKLTVVWQIKDAVLRSARNPIKARSNV